MTVLLDTRAVPLRDRRETAVETLRLATGAGDVVLDGDDDALRARVDLWTLGPATMIRTRSTGVLLRRSERAARAATEPTIALGVHEAGVGVHGPGATEDEVRPGDAVLVDVTRPFAFAWRGTGASRAIQLPVADLALPEAVVRRAGPRLRTSPLHGLVGRFVADLARDADAVAGTPAAVPLGRAALELARALVLSAAGEQHPDPDVARADLLAQVRAYVGQHLRDPDLSAARVAAALHVSERQLYRCLAAAGISLEQWVIARRLEGARAELAHPAAVRRPVEVVAQGWGFVDATHFARRFRAAYGTTPGEWRRAVHEGRDVT